MKIEIIGADSSNGMKIIKNINKAEKEVDIPLDIVKINTDEKSKYGIKVTPTLIINGNVASEGSVITDREIKRIIKSYC